MTIPVTLVDARNIDSVLEELLPKIRACGMLGLDTETSNRRAHAALAAYAKSSKKTIFDARRTTMTGFSTYIPDDDRSYYVNLAHADVENRVPWDVARLILDAKPGDSPFVIHNEPFEERMFKAALGYDIGKQTICTMQLAVSAFGPDEYDKDQFGKISGWEFQNLVPQIVQHFAGYSRGDEMDTHQATLLGKVVGKESDAAWSYNGFNKSIAYGYGLKKLVESFFGYKMLTYAELLKQFGAETMEDLTGEQACQYGGDDSYWAIQILGKLIEMIRPEALEAFSRTENEMTHVFAETALEGININHDAVETRYKSEREEQVKAMALLRDAVEEALPFPVAPNAELLKREDWYAKGHVKYRKMVSTWKRDDKKPYNPVHYMQARTILYDLMGLKLVLDKGKVQSDGEARGKMLEVATGSAKKALEAFNLLAGIDQRIKLYLLPYQALVDPETGKIYPEITSMLSSRRMAGKLPNTMQLAKQGESTYIRGFYLPDGDMDLNPWRSAQLIEAYGDDNVDLWPQWLDEHPDFDPRHGILSVDESQIELVLIGEASGDSAFHDAYAELPYKDLHAKAGAAILRAVTNCPEFTLDDFMALKKGENRRNIPLLNAKGEELAPIAAYKYNRGNAGGKGANFEFWYSGSLGTLAERRGLGYEATQMLVQAYADAFPEAVAWRAEQSNFVKQYGFLDLPDGHRRVRYEATLEWQAIMKNYFRQISDGMCYEDAVTLRDFGDLVIRKISTRAVNQVINARIQGTCAPIIKRSILTARREVVPFFDCRFMFPVHDELVYSVNWDHMLGFIKKIKPVMTNHPDIISTLKQNCSASLGRTFQPYDPDDPGRAPYGQIELDEAPKLDWIPDEGVGKSMDDAQILATIEYMRGTTT